MFPLKSDDIFRSDTRSPAFNVKLLFEQHLVHRMLVFLMSLLLLYVTVKTSVIVLYVVILSVRVVIILLELVNLYILLLVHLRVLQISESLLNSLLVIHILLIPVHLRFALLVIVIFTVNVSCEKVHRLSKALRTMIFPTNLLWTETKLMFYVSLEIIIYLQYFFYQHYFRSF